MGIGNLVEKWFVGIALKKGIKAVVSVVAAFLASAKVAALLQQLGVTIDIGQLTNGLTILGTGLITILLNYLKTKTKLGNKLL